MWCALCMVKFYISIVMQHACSAIKYCCVYFDKVKIVVVVSITYSVFQNFVYVKLELNDCVFETIWPLVSSHMQSVPIEKKLEQL